MSALRLAVVATLLLLLWWPRSAMGDPADAGAPPDAEATDAAPAPAVLEPPADALTRAPDAPRQTVGPVVGAEGPAVVQRWAADRRWVALCQARQDTNGDGVLGVGVGYHGDLHGDRMAPYLVVGGGPGRELDAFVGASADDRWVATVERGRLLLHDTAGGATVDLTAKGAVVPRSTSPFALGPGSFDPRGSRFVYLRGDGARRRAVVLDPATGDRAVLEHGPGRVAGARLLNGGRYAVVQVAPEGKAYRYARTTLAGGPCRGPVSIYSSYGGSNLRSVLVAIPGGPVELDLLSLVDGHSLTRGGDGALTWDDWPGPGRAALTDGTDGFMMATGPGLALLVAAPVGERSELVWARGDQTTRTGLMLPSPQKDTHAGPARVFSHWTEDASWLVDLETGRHLVLDKELDLEGAWAPAPDRGARTFLMRRHDGWAGIADLGDGTVTTLPVVTAPYQPSGVAGRWAFAHARDGGNVVVDLEERRLAGTVRGHAAVGLSDDGLLLMGALEGAVVIVNALPNGPLSWVKPAPLAPPP